MKTVKAMQYECEWQYKQQVKQQRKQSKTFRQHRNSKRSIWESRGE